MNRLKHFSTIWASAAIVALACLCEPAALAQPQAPPPTPPAEIAPAVPSELEREKAARAQLEKTLLDEQTKIATLRGELQTAKDQLGVMKGALEKAQAETTNEKAQAASAIAQLQVQIATLRKELAVGRAQSKQQLDAIEADLKAKTADAERQRINANNAFGAYQRQVSATDSVKQDLNKLLLSLQESESALTKLRADNAKVVTERTKLEGELDRNRAALASERDKQKELTEKQADLSGQVEKLTGVNDRFLRAMDMGKRFHLGLASVLLLYVLVISGVVGWWGINIRRSVLAGRMTPATDDHDGHANAHLAFFSKAAEVTRKTFPPTILASIGFTIVSVLILGYALWKSTDSPIFALMLQSKSWEIIAVFLAPAAALIAIYTFVETRYAEAIKAVGSIKGSSASATVSVPAAATSVGSSELEAEGIPATNPPTS